MLFSYGVFTIAIWRHMALHSATAIWRYMALPPYGDTWRYRHMALKMAPPPYGAIFRDTAPILERDMAP